MATTLIDLQTGLPYIYNENLVICGNNSISGATNGLTSSSTMIELGGTLNHSTTINANQQDFSVCCGSSINLETYSPSSGFTSLNLNNNSTFSSSSYRPLNYSDDYSVNYSDRSIVDQGYVKNLTNCLYCFQGLGGSIVSVSGHSVSIYSVPPSGTTVQFVDVLGAATSNVSLKGELDKKVNISTNSIYTGATNNLINTKLNTTTYKSFTGSTGLQQVTDINAITTKESTFKGGLIVNKIRPTGNTTSAIQINKANGTTNIINIDAISGLTGFGTFLPDDKIHIVGTDITNIGEHGLQKNGLTLDGGVSTDKAITWSENGIPYWQAETFRDENSVFWYLSNVQATSLPLTVMETGRIGINKQSNFLDYHAAQNTIITGLDDLIISGVYTQNYNTVYEIQIASTGATDNWEWRKSIDNGLTYNNWSSPSGCTLTPVLLEYGVYVNFEHITGHGVGASWRFAAFTQIPQGTFTIAPQLIPEVQRTIDYTASPISYSDITAKANGGLFGDTFTIFETGTGGTKNALYLGFKVKVNSVFIDLNIVGSNIVLVTEYWNSNTNNWVSLNFNNNNYIDSTSNLTKSGKIIWTPSTMSGWTRSYIPDLAETGYDLLWIRFRTSTNPATSPLANSISIGNDKRFVIYSSYNDYRPSYYIDSVGRVNIGGGNITGSNKLQVNTGNNTQPTPTGTDSLVEFDSENSAVVDLKLKLASNDALAPGITFVKTRGTLDTSICIQNGDLLGRLDFRGRIGTTGRILAEIIAEYTGTGTTRCGDIIIKTANGSDPIENVRFNYKGNTGFGVSPKATVHIKSGTTLNGQLMFDSGDLVATPQVGLVEFKGNHWFGTTTGSTRNTFAFLESPIFTGNPTLPIGTCFNNNTLSNYIDVSGGTNNITLTKKSCFNLYTGTTAPNSYVSVSKFNTYSGTTAPNTYQTIAKVSTFTGTTLPSTYYNKTQINYYTGTTAPNKYETITNFNSYTGTTAPNTYEKISSINTLTGTTLPNTYQTIAKVSTFTGTTLPNTYYNKTQINTYTGTTAPNNYETITNFNSYTGTTAPILNTTVTGATNGLTKINRKLSLGGNLTQTTVITGSTFDFTLSSQKLNLYSTDNIDISSKGCNIIIYGKDINCVEKTKFNISDTLALFTDSRTTPVGVQYNADYSAGFTNRSLVDKEYVDNHAGGLYPKAAVNVATTGNISLSTLLTVDGIITTTGMRVLVKDQNTKANNGVYSASTGSWGRTSDFDQTAEVVNGSYFFVYSGTTNKNSSWILSTPDPITVGVTALDFSLFSSTSGVQAGNGICSTQSGGNYVISTKLATNCGLCSDPSGLYVNPAIAGVGLNYTTGVLSVCGVNLAGNSLTWSGNTFNVNIASGTLNTALNSKVNATSINTYTGTTAPNSFVSISKFNTYSGTTVPNTYYNKTQINSYTGATNTLIVTKASISNVSTFTGTTLPNTYYNKTQINSYTGATNTLIGTKASIISLSTYTGTTAPNSFVSVSKFNTYSGATNTTLGTKASIISLSTYTGTTAPNKYETILNFNSYTGTTAPNTYEKISNIHTFTGTTLPNNYVSKTTYATYTGATKTILSEKAFLSGATFTGIVRGVSPSQNDNTTCFATTAWYIGQAGTANPLMNGNVAAGTSNLFSRYDHVHPSDTNRVAKAGDTMTGALKINSALTVTGTTRLSGSTYLTTLGTADITTDHALFWNPTSKVVTQMGLTGGSDSYFYTERTTLATSTAGGLVMYLSGTPWTFRAGRYTVDFNTQFGNSTAAANTCVIFAIDGTTIGTCYQAGGEVNNWVNSADLSRDVTLTAGCHCLTLQFARGANTSCVTYGMIRAKRIC